jgi:hypothetical protein
MPKLPRARAAIVDGDKVMGYLISDTHPTGMHKARWLKGCGFSPEKPGTLVRALREHALRNEAHRMESSVFGRRYVIDGTLLTPNGGREEDRSIWFVDRGADVPRLVTLYPRKGSV